MQKTCKEKTLKAKLVINSAGLNAQEVSRRLQVPEKSIPRKFYAKGNYFSLKGEHTLEISLTGHDEICIITFVFWLSFTCLLAVPIPAE